MILISSIAHAEYWQKTFGSSSNDQAYSVQQTSDDGYIVAGLTSSFGAGDSDIWVLKLDGNGNIQWEKTYGGVAMDAAYSVQQTTDGGYIVAGMTNSLGAGNSDIWILKLDMNGGIVWQKTFVWLTTMRLIPSIRLRMVAILWQVRVITTFAY